MSARYFTIEEANELLPEISSLMEALQARRANVIESRQHMTDLLSRGQSDIGGPLASALTQDFMAIEALAHRIKSYGCIVKDLNTGLVDFLSRRDGREVYLCWRFGEPQVAFYHELHTGFRGRRPVEE